MRRLFFALIVIISFGFSPVVPVVNAQLTIGVGAGMQVTGMFRGPNRTVSGDSNKAIPFVGVAFSHPLARHYDLSLESDFVSGSYYDKSFSQKNTQNWVRLNYSLIHTSIIVRRQLNKRFSVGAGLCFFYLGKVNIETQILPVGNPDSLFREEFSPSIRYGIPVSLTYRVKKFVFDLQWNLGLGWIEGGKQAYRKLETLSLGVAYEFHLK